MTFVSARQGRAISGLAVWMRSYLRRAAICDYIVALVSSVVALRIRFGDRVTSEYAVFSLVFPLLWVLVLWFSGAYDDRYIGTGSDEFRKVLNAGGKPDRGTRDHLLRVRHPTVPGLPAAHHAERHGP